MEKLMYSLWKPTAVAADAFRDELLTNLAPKLVERSCVHALRLCVADSAVLPAAKRRMQSHAPVPDALLSLWVDDGSAVSHWEPLLEDAAQRFSGYLVAEAEPLIAQEAHPAAPGERQHGMCQVVFMSYPKSLSREQWLRIWKGSHTHVAIETQSTFGYRQNVVVRVLTEGALASHAIVEENFPPEAMTSDHAFYSTDGDEALLQKNMEAMMESCSRFIDFEHIDVIPMSEYIIAPAVAR